MTLDPRFGYFVNHDLAEYHVPVHADIPAIDAIFLAELDDRSNPLKSKGIGELGICGAAASIGNAVYNACGARIRGYPITRDKLRGGLAKGEPALISRYGLSSNHKRPHDRHDSIPARAALAGGAGWRLGICS